MPELADALRDGKEWKNIKGLCYISKAKPEDAPELASFEECKADKGRFFEAFSRFYKNKCPKTPEISAQKNMLTGILYAIPNGLPLPRRNLTPYTILITREKFILFMRVWAKSKLMTP